MGYIFSWCVLAAATLVWVGRARVRAKWESAFLLFSLAVTILLGVGLGPRGLEEEPQLSWVSAGCDGYLHLGYFGLLRWVLARAWGLGAALLCWFHSFSSIHGGWIGAGVVVLCHWAAFTPILKVVSSLELVLLLPRCFVDKTPRQFSVCSLCILTGRLLSL